MHRTNKTFGNVDSENELVSDIEHVHEQLLTRHFDSAPHNLEISNLLQQVQLVNKLHNG